MKTIKRIRTGLFIANAIIFWGRIASSQDIHFSQFYTAPLMQNPALAGGLYDMRAGINYKEQWKSVAVPYKTTAASFDMRVNKKKSKNGFLAGGVNFFSDKAGNANIKTIQGNLFVAYHVFLNDQNMLGGGMQAGFAHRSISYETLQWSSQFNGTYYDPSLSSGEPQGVSSFGYADAGAGLSWVYNSNLRGGKKAKSGNELKANLGFSAVHFTQPRYSYYGLEEKLFMKYVVHGNALIGIPNSDIAFVPGFMFYKQGPSQEIFAGSLIRYKFREDSNVGREGAAVSAGAFLRAKDAVVISTLFEFSGYAIGISYDVNTSGLTTASDSRGGIEISLRFANPNPFSNKSTASF